MHCESNTGVVWLHPLEEASIAVMEGAVWRSAADAAQLLAWEYVGASGERLDGEHCA